GEEPTLEMDNYQQIPLSTLSENLNKIDAEVEIIVLCQSGERSKNAIQILIQNNFNNCHNLKGGAPALLAQLKHNAV
ncbi:rhodanese-like domain-containing protein, partial [bacterium]|nr:rhodanese-like domain-containing protein [bacterium]